MARPAQYCRTVNLLCDLPLYGRAGHVNVVVEVPRGSAVKLKYDHQTGMFLWSRTLTFGVTYPHDFGFLPRTLADDGDALDALVYADVGSYPGVIVPARVIGALRVEQQRPGKAPKRNDRILVVPANAHRQDGITDIGHVPARLLAELEAFFDASLALTGKVVRFCGWADATEAGQLIGEGHARWAKRENSSSPGTIG